MNLVRKKKICPEINVGHRNFRKLKSFEQDDKCGVDYFNKLFTGSRGFCINQTAVYKYWFSITFTLRLCWTMVKGKYIDICSFVLTKYVNDSFNMLSDHVKCKFRMSQMQTNLHILVMNVLLVVTSQFVKIINFINLVLSVQEIVFNRKIFLGHQGCVKRSSDFQAQRQRASFKEFHKKCVC